MAPPPTTRTPPISFMKLLHFTPSSFTNWVIFMITDNFFFTETLQKAQTDISTFVNSSGILFDVDLQLIVFLDLILPLL